LVRRFLRVDVLLLWFPHARSAPRRTAREATGVGDTPVRAFSDELGWAQYIIVKGRTSGRDVYAPNCQKAQDLGSR